MSLGLGISLAEGVGLRATLLGVVMAMMVLEAASGFLDDINDCYYCFTSFISVSMRAVVNHHTLEAFTLSRILV